MRSALVAALVLGAAAVFSGTSAEAGERAFCMKGQDSGSAHGDCSYDTYEQCLASASGRRNYCDTNPFYAHFAPPVEPRRYRHRRYYR